MKGMGKRIRVAPDGLWFEVSEDSGRDALDVVDSGDSAEGLLQLSTDGIVAVVDLEHCVDFHESECNGEDLGLIVGELDSCREEVFESGDDCVEVHIGALGEEVVCCDDCSHLIHLKVP